MFNIKIIIVILFIFIKNPLWANLTYFTDRECINSDFQIAISSDGVFFDFFVKNLTLLKRQCVLRIDYVQYRFTKVHWEIDVCRGPVHIKKGASASQVILKNQPKSNKNPEFFREKDYILELIQNQALVFAEGVKENLTTPHGKFYCSYLLLSKYLQDGIVFSIPIINETDAHTLIFENYREMLIKSLTEHPSKNGEQQRLPPNK